MKKYLEIRFGKRKNLLCLFYSSSLLDSNYHFIAPVLLTPIFCLYYMFISNNNVSDVPEKSPRKLLVSMCCIKKWGCFWTSGTFLWRTFLGHPVCISSETSYSNGQRKERFISIYSMKKSIKRHKSIYIFRAAWLCLLS